MKKTLTVLCSITLLSNTSIPLIAASSQSKTNIKKSQKQNNENLNDKKTDLEIGLNNNKNLKQIKKGKVKKQNLNITRNRSNSLNKIFKKIKKSSNFSSKIRIHAASKCGTYINFLRESTNLFEITKDVKKIDGVVNKNYPNKKVFKLEKNITGENNKIIPLSTENNEIELVFDTSNLYLEGIITNNKTNKTYWYFSDSKIKQLENNIVSESLGFSGNYSSLAENEKLEITRKDINNSINNLSNITKENKNAIKDDLVRTIFITSEAMRFFSVRNDVKKILADDNKKIIWKDYEDTINDWGKYSKKYFEMLEAGIAPENDEEYNKIINIATLAAKKPD